MIEMPIILEYINVSVNMLYTWVKVTITQYYVKCISIHKSQTNESKIRGKWDKYEFFTRKNNLTVKHWIIQSSRGSLKI